MKQIVGILFLLFTLKLAATGQSRILTGTLSSKANTSMTILPTIVQTKSPELQKEDSGLFNPRYVPPPLIDSSAFNVVNTGNNATTTTSSSNNNNNQTVETVDYQYKAPNPQPLVDNNRGNNLTPSINYRNKKPTTYTPPAPANTNNTTSTTDETTYQYKTADAKPVVSNGEKAKTYTPSVAVNTNNTTSTTNHPTYAYKTPDVEPLVDNGNKSKLRYPVRTKKTPMVGQYNDQNQSDAFSNSRLVTDPIALAATESYGNEPVKKIYTKGSPKTKTWTAPVLDSSVTVATKKPVNKWINPKYKKKPVVAYNANNYYIAPARQQPTYTAPVVSAPPQGGLTPTIKIRSRPNNPVVTTNPSTVGQLQQTANATYSPSADYKINLTTDGKYTVSFFNNGSSINVTQFGRISGVTSPTSNNTTSQYDYRGMLQSVGTLPLQYTYEGRLQSVGNTALGYNYNGNIESIGGTPLSYNYNGTIDKIGNTKVLYDANNNVSGTSNSNPAVVVKLN